MCRIVSVTAVFALLLRAGCSRPTTLYAKDGATVHSFGRQGFIYSRQGHPDTICNFTGCADGTAPPSSFAGLPLGNVYRMDFDGQTFNSIPNGSRQ